MTKPPLGGEPVRPVPGAESRPASLVDTARLRADERGSELAYAFLADGEGDERSLSFGELDRRARALAARLAETEQPGARALLLFPAGLDFLVAFYGCLYAGVLPVPVYPPHKNRTLGRLRAVVRDCGASAVLTDAGTFSVRAEKAASAPELLRLHWTAVDRVDPARADDWRERRPAPDDVAFLQYTSGSTGSPKGVMVTHANLLHNLEQLRQGLRNEPGSTLVSWLPLYHDMGLIGVALEAVHVAARCVLFSPAAFLVRPARWLEAITRWGGTTSGGPDFAYELCARRIPPEERAGLDLSTWRTAFNGSEPVRHETLERFARVFAEHGFDERSLLPGYGLAEATLMVSAPASRVAPHSLAVDRATLAGGDVRTVADEATAKRVVGCGVAFPGDEIAIVDPDTRERLADGAVGEVWFKSPSVARGYWGRAEESEATFRATTTAGDGPWLRTGDLGFLAERELYVTGRAKDLIILRGQNHYPQDLERTVEAAHAELRPGGCAAFTLEVEGAEELALVCELRRPRAPQDDVLAAIRRAVALEHDVEPAAVGLIAPGRLPKTSSGKVQRRAARAAWLSGALEPVDAWRAVPDDDEPPVAPPPTERSAPALEAWLAELVAARLGCEPAALDRTAPLAALGLDSLGVLRLAHRMEAALGLRLRLAALFEGASVSSAARELAEHDAPEAEGPRTEVAKDVLSCQERALWLSHGLDPESAADSLTAAVRVLEPFDTAALGAAIESLLERHEALRTAYRTDREGHGRRQVHAGAPSPLRTVDATDWSELRLTDELAAEAARPFDLERLPLLRATWYAEGQGAGVLQLAAHHVVLDHWSLPVLFGDLFQLYRAHRTGAPLAPAPGARYRAYAQEQARELATPAVAERVERWRERLADAPLLELPTDRRRPARRRRRGTIRRRVLSPALWQAVVERAREAGVTPYVACLTAFEVLLARDADQDEFLLGTLRAERERERYADVVGYFVDPLVLRADLSGDPRLTDAIERARRAVARSLGDAVPFAHLLEHVPPARDPSRSPWFSALFAWQHSHHGGASDLAPFALGLGGARLELGGVPVETLAVATSTSQFDLSLTMAELETPDGSACALALELDTDLFEADTAARWEAQLVALLEGLAADPGQRVSAVARAASPPVTTYASDERSPFERLLETRADEDPHAPALIEGARVVSRGELDARTERLARSLIRRGVGPETVVALHAGRSVETCVAILAVAKAGAAWLPLAPELPPAAVERRLRAAGAELVLHAHGVEPVATLERLQLDESAPAPPPPQRPARTDPVPAGAAYVLFTSGSTGEPKAVVVPRGALAAHVHAARRAFAWTRDDRVLHAAAVGFDLGIEEWIPALAAGAAVVIHGAPAPPSMAELSELVERHGITVLDLPTAYWHEWTRALDAGDARVPSCVRQVIAGGERVSAALFARWREHAHEATQWLNTYGPTETAVTATLYEPPAGPWDSALEVPIGRAVTGYRADALDRFGRSAPLGVPGELAIGGAGVARGYRGDPRATAAAFVPDPDGPPGARRYLSGDRVRWRRLAGQDEPQLEFLGRRDTQVKVRGFRIEPAELEAELARHPAVAEAVAGVRDDDGAPRLLAWVLPRAGHAPAPEELRAWLRERLPAYLVPAALDVVDALPRGRTGKLDRRALPTPKPARAGDATPHAFASREQRELARIWSEVLGVEAIAPADDFFALGGDSIRGLQVSARARRAGVEVSPADLFQHPTLEALAARAEANGPPSADAGEEGPGPVPLTPIQRWFFEQELPQPAHWNLSAVLQLRRAIDRPVLARALSQLERRHDALRLRFEQGPQGWQARSVEPAGVELTVVEAEAWDESTFEARCDELQASLDLARGPLLRAALFRAEGETPDRLLAVAHHLALDAVSWHVLVDELEAVVGALESDREPDLPPPTTAWSRWAREVQSLDDARTRQRIEAWVASLSALPARFPLRPPTDETEDAPLVAVSLDPERTAALLRGPAVLASSLETVLVGALARVVAQDTREDGVWLELESHGRDALPRDASGTVGWFTALRPVLLNGAADGELADVLSATRRALEAAPTAAAWSAVRFGADPPARVRALPAPQVQLNFLGHLDDAGERGFGLAWRGGGRDRALANARRAGLELDVAVGDGRLQAQWSWGPRTHTRAAVEELARHFLATLEELAATSPVTRPAPEDFPLADLTGADLSKVLERVKRGGGA